SSSAPSSPSPRKPESPHWSSRWPGSSSSSASPWWPWAGACARQTSGSRPTRIATVPTTAAATSSAARSSTEIRPPRRGLPHLNGSATRTSAIRTPAAGCPNRLHSHDRGIRVDCHSRFLCPCSPAPAHLPRLARIASDLEFHVNSRRTASTEIRPPRRGLPHLNGSATRTSAIRTPAAGCPNRLHSHDRGIRVDCHSRFLCPCSPAPAHLPRLARIASDLEFHVNSRRTASTVHQLFPTP